MDYLPHVATHNDLYITLYSTDGKHEVTLGLWREHYMDYLLTCELTNTRSYMQ